MTEREYYEAGYRRGAGLQGPGESFSFDGATPEQVAAYQAGQAQGEADRAQGRPRDPGPGFLKGRGVADPPRGQRERPGQPVSQGEAFTGEIEGAPAAQPGAFAVGAGGGWAVLGAAAGVGGLLLSVLALRSGRKTRRQLDRSEAEADSWLRDNYELWRGQERAAAKDRRRARRAARGAA